MKAIILAFLLSFLAIGAHAISICTTPSPLNTSILSRCILALREEFHESVSDQREVVLLGCVERLLFGLCRTDLRLEFRRRFNRKRAGRNTHISESGHVHGDTDCDQWGLADARANDGRQRSCRGRSRLRSRNADYSGVRARCDRVCPATLARRALSAPAAGGCR